VSSTARELVEGASELLRTADNESHYRAVCSRAYYGAFHAAQAFHRALPAPGSVGAASGRHEQLIQQLCNPMLHSKDENRVLSQAIGQDLIKLRDARVRADYHLTRDIDHALAMQSASLAANIIRMTT
jgi:uncharacterized protein (UPF0332 family)